MIGAGQLRDKVRFDARGLDANGDPLGPWGTVLTCRANIEYLRGSEVALSYRLERRQPVVVTVRADEQTRAISPAMRMANARTGELYNITAAAPAKQRGYINILAVAGGAVG